MNAAAATSAAYTSMYVRTRRESYAAPLRKRVVFSCTSAAINEWYAAQEARITRLPVCASIFVKFHSRLYRVYVYTRVRASTSYTRAAPEQCALVFHPVSRAFSPATAAASFFFDARNFASSLYYSSPLPRTRNAR